MALTDAFAAVMRDLLAALEADGVIPDEDYVNASGRLAVFQELRLVRFICQGARVWSRLPARLCRQAGVRLVETRAQEFDRARHALDDAARRARVEFAHELAVTFEGRLPREIVIQIHLEAAWG